MNGFKVPTRWIPHAIAAAVTVPFAIWVATSDLRGVLNPAAWLLPLAAAYYLGLRIGREIVRGVLRAREEKEDESGRWMGPGSDENDNREEP